MPANIERIGLFGGTFDPVHCGHLIVAQAVLEEIPLDRLIFIPSANPPHKGGEIMFDAVSRLRFLELAAGGDPRFSVSDIELNRSGPSYTIDTIREIRKSLPDGAEIFFIVGKDNLAEMESWKDPLSIFDSSTVAVAERSFGSGRPAPPWIAERILPVRTPVVDISSSDIRRRLREGTSIRYLVPDAVREAIIGTLSSAPGR